MPEEGKHGLTVANTSKIQYAFYMFPVLPIQRLEVAEETPQTVERDIHVVGLDL